MDIARGVDKNQCDIKILEVVVRFISLADSQLGNTVHGVKKFVQNNIVLDFR